MATNPDSNDNAPLLARIAYKGIYVLAILFILLKVYEYRHYNFGYTILPHFSQHAHERAVDDLKRTEHYVSPGKHGYDGQYYAQLALEPQATGAEIERALDNHIYRARRILFSWTAWIFGLGDPYWVLQAYSVQNALFWLLTALLLMRWFPATHWQNTLRFLLCLFTAGIAYSFDRALLDGPSLFLIALGAACLESGRGWLGTAVLSLSGLGKETNLLACAGLWEPDKRRQSLIRIGLAMIPLLIWLSYLLASSSQSPLSSLGGGNFALPLVGFFASALMILKEGGETGFPAEIFFQFALMAALLGQCLYFLARPKPDRVWWRIGVSFAVLTLFLGEAVWEEVEAAPRVLLPMTIAFNLLFSRKTIWLPILLTANILSIAGIARLDPVYVPERYDIRSASNLGYDPATNRYSTLEFGEGWYINEGHPSRFWRWSSGDAKIGFRIPGERKVRAIFSFTPRSLGEREITLEINGESVWSFRCVNGYGEGQRIELILQPGDNNLRVSSAEPPLRIGQDPRDLSFALYEYKLDLIEAVQD